MNTPPSVHEQMQMNLTQLSIYTHYVIRYNFSSSAFKAAFKITCFLSGHDYLPLNKEKYCSRCLKKIKTK